MNDQRIQELAEQANAWFPDGYPSAEGGDEAWQNLVIFEKEDLQQFTKLVVGECVQRINDEIDRLCEYQNSLPEWDENRRDDCDLVIEKCLDIISGLRREFGFEGNIDD